MTVLSLRLVINYFLKRQRYSSSNENYEKAKVPVIEYAMLQFETATMAWFGRKLTTAYPEAQLTFEELVSGWHAILKQEIPNRPLDSDRLFPYYEI